MILRAALLATFLPAAALAAEEAGQMSPEAFEAYVTGKTLMYGFDGQNYGGEDYLANRRVRWSFLDGRCKSGRWYPENGAICFVYEDNPDPQCWSFRQGESGLIARFENNTEYQELYEVGESAEPLLCLGPDVGV